jgi:hypothetical protein
LNTQNHPQGEIFVEMPEISAPSPSLSLSLSLSLARAEAPKVETEQDRAQPKQEGTMQYSKHGLCFKTYEKGHAEPIWRCNFGTQNALTP